MSDYISQLSLSDSQKLPTFEPTKEAPMSKFLFFTIFLIFIQGCTTAQTIPSVYSNIHYDKEGKLYYLKNGVKLYANNKYVSHRNLKNFKGNPTATQDGIEFDFGQAIDEGKIYYGLIHYYDSKHPMPVWYKKKAKIEAGKTNINIMKYLSGIYDMSDWQKIGFGTVAYRILSKKGKMRYEGIISFKYNEKTGFSIANTITEGPFINKLADTEVTVWFETNRPIIAKVLIGGRTYSDKVPTTKHEIRLTGLTPSTHYTYTVDYIDYAQKYELKTAPKAGSRQPFSFAYVSDSRAGNGGGERDLGGTNFYAMRKIAALSKFYNVSFMQFTGDLVNGYTAKKEQINVQYANWKRAVEPFWHYFPIVPAVGNHEANGPIFKDNKGKYANQITGFPFETESTSAVFAQNFVNPVNGPPSEDGAYYDPNPNKVDFPSYDETVFYYTYDNVAIIVLNSNYFYVPTIGRDPNTSGNLHGYLMDQQLNWLKKVIAKFEVDPTIDHIFTTQHTPTFPNSAHVSDDMWYNGDNSKRPFINGNPVKKGIIDRRDEYLNIIVNQSTKVVAILTGDEHNYNKVKITPDVNIYPDNYPNQKLKRTRTIWQVNNGSAGAPYYAQDKSTPWTDAVSGFTTQFALVIFQVDGKKVSAKVYNPDTLELMDEWTF